MTYWEYLKQELKKDWSWKYFFGGIAVAILMYVFLVMIIAAFG